MKPLPWLLFAPLLLNACGGDESLHDWIRQTETAARPLSDGTTLPELPLPPVYTPPAQPQPDAFDRRRLRSAAPPDATPARSGILEAFGLDELRYVGWMQNGKRFIALVEADGKVYRVQRGDFLGSGSGRLKAVTPQALLLETVEGATVREQTLPLSRAADAPPAKPREKRAAAKERPSENRAAADDAENAENDAEH